MRLTPSGLNAAFPLQLDGRVGFSAVQSLQETSELPSKVFSISDFQKCPTLSSQQRMVIGKVVLELDVEKSSSNASRIALFPMSDLLM
jgi:hypothetical protein